MEVKDPKKDQKPLAGDLRLPESEEAYIRGPSRGRAMLHLAGIGLGLLLLLLGAGLGFSRDMWDKLALMLVISGGALVAGWVTINHRFLLTVVRNRRVLVGTNAVFMGILAVVLLLMVNFISYRHYWKWDITQTGLFTLAPKTQNVLKALNKDVVVLVFRFGDRPTGEEYTYAKLQELLRLYTDASQHIKVEYPIVAGDPTGAELLVKKYNIEANWQALRDIVYVVCGQKKKTLHLGMMTQWEYFGDQFNPQRRPLAFKGEQYITSAIIEVTEEKQTKAYALTGHGETSIQDRSEQGMAALAGLLKWENIVVEELAGVPPAGVPQDCDCLLVLSPQAALAREEVDRIKRYLERGGRMFLCEDIKQKSGLEELLAGYGVKLGEDVVIATDQSGFELDPAVLLVYKFGDHEISNPLKEFRVLVAYSRSVEAIPGASNKARVTTLLETTKDSYRETDVDELINTQQSRQDAQKDKGGPVGLAAAVEEVSPPRPEQTVPGKEKKLARIVVFGDADVFSNYGLNRSGPNRTLCLNTINWLVERKELVAIESRPETERTMFIDDAAKKTVFLLLVIGLPLAVLLLGGVVWAVRSYGSRAA